MGMGEQIKYPVRYTVQTIEKYADSSVRSDFGTAIGLRNCTICSDGVDNFSLNGELPDHYSLDQNYPNPFNPVTTIKFDLPFVGNVSIKIYDINGRLIKTLINENRTAGRYDIVFNGENLSSGIYYYKIRSGNFEGVRKMLLIK